MHTRTHPTTTTTTTTTSTTSTTSTTTGERRRESRCPGGEARGGVAASPRGADLRAPGVGEASGGGKVRLGGRQAEGEAAAAAAAVVVVVVVVIVFC